MVRGRHRASTIFWYTVHNHRGNKEYRRFKMSNALPEDATIIFTVLRNSNKKLASCDACEISDTPGQRWLLVGETEVHNCDT